MAEVSPGSILSCDFVTPELFRVTGPLLSLVFQVLCDLGLSRLPPRTHAAPAHPARRNGPNTHAHPARRNGPNTHVPVSTLCTLYPVGPRKQAFLHMAAVRARLWQQDLCQCTWHGIGRLSRRRHGDRMSGRGSPCGALFFVLSHFGADPLDFVTVSVCLCVFITAGPITKL